MITRDGKPSGLYRASMTDEAGMDAMIAFARHKAASLAEDAFSGVIDDKPASFGTYSACASCDYSAVCGFDPTVKKRRRLSKKSVEDLNSFTTAVVLTISYYCGSICMRHDRQPQTIKGEGCIREAV